jgi:hypothetical protein
MDTLPSSRLAPRGRRVPPGLLSTHPPCEGAAGLSPARETPCWAHNPNRRITGTGNCGKHESERLPMRSQGRASPCTPSHTGGPSDAFDDSELAAGGQG